MIRGLLILVVLFLSPPLWAIDLAQVERELQTTGAVGWIHGAAHENGVYVFTYRNPENFFDYYQFSLVARGNRLREKLRTFKRHDRVRVKGNFQPDARPQTHIWLSDIEMDQAWDKELPEYEREVQLPRDIAPEGDLIVKIHAVAAEGQVLVSEYKDAIIPIFVEPSLTVFTKDLFRGDKVRISYFLRKAPRFPAHIGLNPNVEKPVEVLDAMLDQAGKLLEFQGPLVMFPQSPEIIFNVFALNVSIGDGLVREYTLVNFENPDLFRQIREKLQAAWDSSGKEITNARNKLIQKDLIIRARGIINVQAPNQANPQILLDSLEDLEILKP